VGSVGWWGVEVQHQREQDLKGIHTDHI